MIVAIDGPAAAGKGTLARRLAAAFELAYLDTGSLYRATACRHARTGEAPAVAAKRLSDADRDDPDLRSEAISRLASKVSAEPAVRQALLDYQRDFAHRPPDGKAGAVLDGRDIGTVVCPDADVKLFVTASLETRAGRRHAELAGRDEAVTLDQVRADLARRDADDASRATAPLKPADDAHLLDTSDLDIEPAFDAARAIVAAAIAARASS
ncbi:MAG: (d)CMP kinase [Alphaproteobacteria bacterium]